MFENHSALYEPQNNCCLWQYMSFSKFVNLLLGKMYFRRIDSFEDIFEGRWPVLNQKAIENLNKKESLQFGRVDEFARKLTFVSCFHKSEFETAFMWKQYSDKDGIAIKTSLDNLKKSFSVTETPVYISDVKYIDYNTEPINDMGNMFSLAIHKRKSFQYENEVRCLCLLPGLNECTQYFDKEKKIDFEKIPTGTKLTISISDLIKDIYISPYAESYLKENVEACIKAAGLSAKVIESSLYKIN